MENITEKLDLQVAIIDDDPQVCRLLNLKLNEAGYSVTIAQSAEEARSTLRPDTDVVLLDFDMPGTSGLDYLAELKNSHKNTEVVMFSGSNRPEVIVESMKRGAFWYLTKTASDREVIDLLGQAGKHALLAKKNTQLKNAISAPTIVKEFTSVAAKSQELIRRMKQIADLSTTVMIAGESGTGKSSLAYQIHAQGPRRDKPFVTVGCASLPRDLLESELFGHEKGAFTGAASTRLGRIEMADGGTLFLDEIGDLPLELQPKLLLFLQDRIVQRVGSNKGKKVDVRVIAATHQPLEKLCEEKRFRQDLYFRLNVLNLTIDPLRERREDILPLANSYLEKIGSERNSRFTLTPEAQHQLETYSWPGNVRELENILERAAAFSEGGIISEDLLGLSPINEASPTKSQAASLLGLTLEEIERRAISESLEACGGSKSKAAKMLGISEKSIYNKLHKFSSFTK